MMKKFYFILLAILLMAGVLSGCVEKTCETDADCAYMYESGGECETDEVISPTAFCIEGSCQCQCGYRDSEGNFIERACE